MNGENNSTQPVAPAGWQFKPDDGSKTSVSSTTIDTSPTQAVSPTPPVSPVASPAPQNPNPLDLQPQPVPVDTQPLSQGDNPAQQPESNFPQEQPEVEWSASEFIAHDKGTSWYLTLAIAAVCITVLVYIISRDIFSVVAVMSAMVAFGYVAKRKPQTIAYHIGPDGLSAKGHTYSFSNFKSFGLQDEGTFASLVFMPMKRFMLPLYIYFPPEEHDHIIEVLSHYVPFSPVTQGLVERTSHRIRF